MYTCNTCNTIFTKQRNLQRHKKLHDGVTFLCHICQSSYSRKEKLYTHLQKKHGLSFSTMTSTVNNVPGPSHQPVKRSRVDNNTVKFKKARMQLTDTTGFAEIDSALNRGVVWFYRKNVENSASYQDFLRIVKPELVAKLSEVAGVRTIKYNLKLEATYHIPKSESPPENRAFKTSARAVFTDTDIGSVIDDDFAIILAEEDVYAGKGSGFTLTRIDGLLVGIYKYTPLNGSYHLPLPREITYKKAVINPRNTDDFCFKWAILARHVKGDCYDHKNRVNRKYFNEEYRYDFSELSFPTPVSEIKIFEQRNPNVSVNVYGLEQGESGWLVYPLRVNDQEQQNHFDLLYVDDSEKTHYAYISNFSRLVRRQKTKHDGRIFTCKRCFTSFDDRVKKHKLCGREALEQHKTICGKNKPVLPVMPAEGSTVSFDKWEKTQRLPFVIYADFEAMLVKSAQRLGMNTQALHTHHPMSYGYVVKTSDDVPVELLERYGIPQTPMIFRGSTNCDKVAKSFVKTVTDVARNISKLLRETNIPIQMTLDDVKVHGAKMECDICRKTFTDSNPKVADHCHLSGRFRQTLCNACNLKVKTPNFVPCFLHNLLGYDAHFIVTELGYDNRRISVIPNSEEKYISFTKHVTNNFSVRFVDTYRFMGSSLSTLAANLITPEFSKFRETAKMFSPENMPLVTRKGVYPYEYTDSWDKLDKTELPSQDAFYSELNESHVDDNDYRHASEVWDHFGCATLGEYSDLYLKIDVLLLTDVFENFRDICISAYNLDPAHYFTAPGFSFDCMLKYTGVKLELLNDYDMLLMIEQGIRGGLVQASMHHAKANNYKTPNYDPRKPNTWIVYQDCNNLYGWAMSRPMPYGGFRWYEGADALADLDSLSDTGDTGRIYEVDVSYPKGLHDEHNDLPFLPHNSIPLGSKVTKLMATLETKKRYIVHYINLKQAIAHGLQVEKVHRVLEFKQCDWLKKYINLNTKMRKQAANDFEKDFFKLMNNAVFGKTMENMRKRMRIELVSCPHRLRKLINQPTFKHCTKYSENLCAVAMDTKVIKFNKPIYVGLAVLDISKTLMYEYYYDVLKQHYGDTMHLVYMDTDSFVYHLEIQDYYQDLADSPDLLQRLDESSLPKDHPSYSTARKKTPGLFSDETGGQTLFEFVGLRSKSYAYNLEGSEHIKAKGIRGHVVRNHISMNDLKRCLFKDNDDDNDDDASKRLLAHDNACVVVKAIQGGHPLTSTQLPYTPYRQNVSIRSFKHEVRTVRTTKLALNRFDDKRHTLDNRVNTVAHGHYTIQTND